MRERRLTAAKLGTALAVSAIAMAGCGGEGDESSRASADAPRLASAGAIERDPYAIACGHVRDQQKWADVTRRATVAIADQERFRNLNRLQATQSLFFAMTEFCKGRSVSYQPAKAAVRGVQEGKFEADLGTP
jgi:hypothetical protein